MEKKIIVINGTGGSGKDTFVSYCEKYCKIYNFSSIDKIKEIATIMGWDGGKTEKDRKFLADLKALATNYNDLPFNCIKESINEFYDSNSDIMFIHIREPKEIKRVVDEYNALSLLIKRKNYELIKSNTSDANVENYDYDYIVENETLDKLDENAKKFIDELLNKSNLTCENS